MDQFACEVLDDRGSAWFDAVAVRRSRRAYDSADVDPTLLAELENVCTRFRPYPDARVELVKDTTVDVFRGAVGSYGKVTGARHLMVVVAAVDRPEAQHHAGFTGEACVLEASALGLSTCWVGGFFDRTLLTSVLPLADGERAVAVTPVGYPAAPSSSEQIMQGIAGSHSRKPLAKIAADLDDTWPAWARAAVECARLAPSAVNRQPWRFRMSGDSLIVRAARGVDVGVSRALDCGIAMLHAQLGAGQLEVSGEWHDCQDGDIARFVPKPSSG